MFDKGRNVYFKTLSHSGSRKSLRGSGRLWHCLIALTFHLMFVCGIGAQEVEERPLRAVEPQRNQSVSFITSHTVTYPPLPANSLITDAALEQALTQHYIKQYSSTGGVALLNSVMERGNIYLPFIKEEVARRNLPPELAYLPIIESGFQITARSRSGAVGLWQFMMNSISPFDIKVTDLIDERRDFIKSTIGALQKLEENYRTLGSWELALAAYNSGLNGMNRIIKRTGISDYWELGEKKELKSETMSYVPKLIAVAYILSRPKRFGINVWHKKFEWEAIPLQRQVSLDIVAKEAGIEIDLMRRLNAELLHGISPTGSGYSLKIPTVHLEQVTAVLEREDLKLIRYYYHVVRNGDTLWSMTRHYGIALNIIEQHNPGISNRYLRIGETVVIPAFSDVAPLTRTAVTQRFDGRHLVQKGETFWSLSRMYGVDPEVLAEENGMQLNQILHEGRTLKVPIIDAGR